MKNNHFVFLFSISVALESLIGQVGGTTGKHNSLSWPLVSQAEFVGLRLYTELLVLSCKYYSPESYSFPVKLFLDKLKVKVLVSMKRTLIIVITNLINITSGNQKLPYLMPCLHCLNYILEYSMVIVLLFPHLHSVIVPPTTLSVQFTIIDLAYMETFANTESPEHMTLVNGIRPIVSSLCGFSCITMEF